MLLPGSTQARKLLVREALQYLDNLSKDSDNDRILQLELATAYQKLGDVQGYIYGPNLGDTAGAAASYSKALRICESLSIETPQDIQIKQQLATLYGRISSVLETSGDTAGALQQASQPLAAGGIQPGCQQGGGLAQCGGGPAPGSQEALQGQRIAWAVKEDIRLGQLPCGWSWQGHTGEG